MTAKAKKPRAKATAAKKETNWIDLPSKLEIAFAHVLMGQAKRSVNEAGKKLGMTEREAQVAANRPRVKRYIASYIQAFIDKMAAKEVQLAVEGGITRDRIARRLMQLAEMNPSETRYTINGQVDAALGCAKVMGFEIAPRDMDEFFRGKTDEQIANYAAYGTFEKPTAQ